VIVSQNGVKPLVGKCLLKILQRLDVNPLALQIAAA